MRQRFIKIAAASSLIAVMGLGASTLAASAKTSTQNTSKKTTLGRVIVPPKAVSGTHYIMTIKKGSNNYVVTFNTADVKVINNKGASLAVDKIAVGNKIQVKGTMDSSSKKIAKVSKIKDDSVS